MLGTRSPQSCLFAADNEYLDRVGRDSFYGFLALNRHEIFRDDDFAELYSRTRGRESAPPSMLAVALLLQTYNRTSDAESVERATFDARWSVALGTEVGRQPFAKSTLCCFRARLILNDQAMAIFQRSLSRAREVGFLKNRKLREALDTTHIFGAGAVKDTYNLLADGIRKLVKTLERFSAKGLSAWLKNRLSLYFGKSFKGTANIDWDDPKAREALLNTVVTDIKSLLLLAQEHKNQLAKDDAGHFELEEAMRLLTDLVEQDIDQDENAQAAIKQGVAKDRIASVHDPEMRHGRKSKSTRFDGHKATIAVDTDTQLITAVDVIAGNAHDSENALALCEQTQSNTGCEVETVLGDCAYGTAELRKEFEQAGINLVAKAPQLQANGFEKDRFTIDFDHDTVTCPAGQTTNKWRRAHYKHRDGTQVPTKVFAFSAKVCGECEFYRQCVKAIKPRRGRTITLHPNEALLRETRAFQKTETFKEQYRPRSTVEHRIARLVQLGVRKARYWGRKKTAFQLAMAAAVANFTLLAAWQAQNPADSASILVFAFILVAAMLTSLYSNGFRRNIPQGVQRQPRLYRALPKPIFRPDF